MKGGISLKDKPVFKRMAVVGFVNEWLETFVKLNTRRHCLFTNVITNLIPVLLACSFLQKSHQSKLTLLIKINLYYSVSYAELTLI